MATAKVRASEARREGRPSAASADLLIEAAEALMAEGGVAGVSLREISRAAGQGNNNAVQYHFGDLAGLIGAIQRKRLVEIERRRADMLAAARAEDRLGDLRRLTDILYRPLLDQRTADGEQRYARFLLAVLSSPGAFGLDMSLFDAMPVSREVLRLMQAAAPHLSMELVLERQRLIALMVLNCAFNRSPGRSPELSEAVLLDDALAMATAALAAHA